MPYALRRSGADLTWLACSCKSRPTSTRAPSRGRVLLPLFGFLHRVRHAREPDHLLAVSTLRARLRPGIDAGLELGASIMPIICGWRVPAVTHLVAA